MNAVRLLVRLAWRMRGFAGALALDGCAGAKPVVRQPPIPVRVTAAATISAPVTIVANGVVEPLGSVSVLSQVGGTLTDVNFREGDNVTRGQILFRIDPRPFESAVRQAEGMLARDQAQSVSAKRDAERYDSLAAKDYVTRSQADAADAASGALEATLKSDSAAVEAAKLNLEYTTIRAPLTGRTGRLLVRQGNLVSPGVEPLVLINQLQPILVRFPVPASDLAALQRRVAAGSDVPVRALPPDSMSERGGSPGAPGAARAESGLLSFIDNAVDSLTGTVTAKGQFTNTDGALWPGEYVLATVELNIQTGVIAVPSVAIVPGQDGSYVFVVEKDQTVKMSPVSVGREIGTMTIIDRGVQVGDRIVVDGQSRLTSGAKVDAKEQPTRAADASRPGGSGS